MSLITLVYFSTATRPMTDQDLMQILETSRRNNPRDKITGMLLYGNGLFIQALEGEEQIVTQTYNRIQQDERHSRSFVVSKTPIASRAFGEWNMGFQNVGADALSKFAGADGFIAQPIDEALLKSEPAHAARLLRWFAAANLE